MHNLRSFRRSVTSVTRVVFEKIWNIFRIFIGTFFRGGSKNIRIVFRKPLEFPLPWEPPIDGNMLTREKGSLWVGIVQSNMLFYFLPRDWGIPTSWKGKRKRLLPVCSACFMQNTYAQFSYKNKKKCKVNVSCWYLEMSFLHTN